MLNITISSDCTGCVALLYELRGREGRRAFRPTYHATAVCSVSGRELPFAVVRDTSPQIFNGQVDHYGNNGECPPSKPDQPYHAWLREDGRVGPRLQLYDPLLSSNRDTIQGIKGPLRKNIQIHVGAASSFGCMGVAGRRTWYYRKFVPTLRAMINQSNEEIRVTVYEREV